MALFWQLWPRGSGPCVIPGYYLSVNRSCIRAKLSVVSTYPRNENLFMRNVVLALHKCRILMRSKPSFNPSEYCPLGWKCNQLFLIKAAREPIYFDQKVRAFQKPFFSMIFTISSHHPFTIPKEFTNKVRNGPDPICKSINYADFYQRSFW